MIKKIVILAVFLGSTGCAEMFVAAYNPNSLSDEKLAHIGGAPSGWADSYHLIAVDGTYAPGIRNPAKSDVFRRIAPGRHLIEWRKESLATYVDGGTLCVEIESGQKYDFGVRDEQFGVDLWIRDSGESAVCSPTKK